jgi:Fe-S-cluster containining protein
MLRDHLIFALFCSIFLSMQPFYKDGLRFSCARCSSCCRYESGFVFLSEADTVALAAALNMGRDGFIAAYCRWVPLGEVERLSLRETVSAGNQDAEEPHEAGYDCVFWKDGCAVYGSRPLQCRTFPFWRSVLASAESWARAAGDCPGMGSGALHSAEEIEGHLAKRQAEPAIERPITRG